MSEKLRK